jgi:tetratricopeptide (TPR) repeat protein
LFREQVSRPSTPSQALLLALATALLLTAQSPPDPLEAAREAERAGRLAEAEAHYERALAAKPTAETWQRLGLVRHLQNKFAQAIPAFEKALAADPKLWGSHLFLGIDLYRTNRFADALASLKRAEDLQPGHPEVLFWLGAANLALGQYPDGLKMLEQRLAADPKNVEVLQLLASAYREYSLALWNGVAERHFETAPGQVVHGYALEAQGSWEEALAAYTKAAALQPRRPGIHLAIGRVLLRQSKPELAAKALEREVELGGAAGAEARSILEDVRARQ